MASTTLPATGKRGRIAEAAPFDPWAFDLASGNGPAGDGEPRGAPPVGESRPLRRRTMSNATTIDPSKTQESMKVGKRLVELCQQPVQASRPRDALHLPRR